MMYNFICIMCCTKHFRDLRVHDTGRFYHKDNFLLFSQKFGSYYKEMVPSMKLGVLGCE